MSGKSRHGPDVAAAGGAPGGAPAPELPPLSSVPGAGSSTYELLRTGLDRAVAVVQALGGMVHLGAPGSRSLYLAVETGIEGPSARHWEEVDRGSPDAPACAVRTNAPAWAAVSPGLDASPPGLPTGTGLLSVPMPAPDGPLGALSAFTRMPQESALHEQLMAVAVWIADCLRGSAGHPGPTDTGRPGHYPAADPSVGFWGWDFRTGRVIWDGAALDILGIDAKGFDGRIRTWRRLVHPQDLPLVLARADEAIRAHTLYQVEFRVRQPDGGLRRVEGRGQASSLDDSSGPRLAGIVRDISPGHLARESAEQALGRMRDGLLAVDHTGRITFANPEAERLLAPSGRLLGNVLWEAVPALRTLGLQEVDRQTGTEGRPTELDIHSDTGRWLHVRLAPLPDGLTVCVTDINSTRRRQAEEAAAEGAAVERAARIAELTRALAVAVTGHDVAGVMATHMVPLFGAKGVGVWVNEDGRAFLVGSSGYSNESLHRFEGARISELSAAAQTFLTGTPNFISTVEEFIGRYPELSDLPVVSGAQAWAILPLIASGHSIGVACITYDRPHLFSSEERTLFTAMSGMVAQAMERARLFDAEHRRAHELQRALLPRTLPALLAVSTAARYQPAGDGMDVGGDWYDVIPLSSERVALAIGDVMGHGLREAVTMSRLRTAGRALADLEQPLDELFFHINEGVSALGDDFYATCLCIVYDPASRLCQAITAGHPPPVVLLPDGTTYFPDLPVNSPLGAAAPPFDTAEFSLPDGALLALYTDGLVASDELDIDEGMDRLARHLHLDRPGPVRAQGTEPLDDLCDRVVTALLPEQRVIRDDSALLVARVHALAPEDTFCRRLPDDPKAAGQARTYVRDQLTAWNLDELITTTELVVSELVGNVVRHARGPITLRLLRGRTLVCEVTDASPTMPRIRRAADTDESGRGLQLIAALTSRWGARYTSSGKCLWTEQPLTADLPR
ncbi:SpoIIE family protein phosphatase [Streptomyces sp. NPDC052036]|uniref:SpoIIE family protein phosphatase n=1 Tax=Streptomyces sp. NPDC052036 TaxID=3155171 RepID=UPI003435789B